MKRKPQRANTLHYLFTVEIFLLHKKPQYDFITGFNFAKLEQAHTCPIYLLRWPILEKPFDHLQGPTLTHMGQIN